MCILIIYFGSFETPSHFRHGNGVSQLGQYSVVTGHLMFTSIPDLNSKKSSGRILVAQNTTEILMSDSL